jgi:phenylalanyl-tRNA synthetase beta chain
MVMIEVSKQDLLNLLGKNIDEKELEESLFLLKVETETSDDTMQCELNPDRPDMFSVEGIARALKGFLEIEKGIPEYEISNSNVILTKEKPEVRPHVVCAIVKDVELTDELIKSLMQIQEKLHMTIGRDRKKVAIGVHDYDKIKPPLTYKDVDDIRFIPLQDTKEMNVKEILTVHPKGKAYAHLLKDKYPMILDQEGVISFPPIINSERTKVTEETRNLFIDVTGTDERSVEQVLNIVVCNICERSGKIETVKVSKKIYPKLKARTITLDSKYINNLIGLQLDPKEISNSLEKMRFDSKARGQKITVSIPGFRSDILHEIDIVEDVAVGYGYNKIEPTIPEISTIGSESEKEIFSRKIRELMIGLGFQETLNFILTNRENNFNKMSTSGESIEILNPVSSEYDICRTWLLPSLMKFLTSNKHLEFPQNVFEIGDVILLDNEQETKTSTIRKLAGSMSYDEANLTKIKSIIESILNNLNLKYEIKPFNHPSFIDSRAGEIIVNEKSIGFFGEINPEILEKWGLERPTIAFEINVDDLYG